MKRTPREGSFFLIYLYGMKNKYILMTAIAFMFAGANAVSAQETGIRLDARAEMRKDAVEARMEVRANASGTRPMPIEKREERLERRDDMREKASSTRAEIQERREEMKDRAEARRAFATSTRVRVEAKIASRAPEVSAKLVAATERLAEISGKITARLEKIEASGKDMTEGKNLLVSANALIEAAKVKAEAVSTVAVFSDDIEESFEALKTATKEAREAIKEAHSALVNVIKGIKPGIAPSVNATSSAQVN